MNITVVGAGAMGSLFGGLLAESGAEVRLLDVWAEHIRAIREQGLRIEKEGHTRSVHLQGTTDPEAIGRAELVIVFVKSTHTELAAHTAKTLVSPEGSILTLQNGMGNADTLASVVDPAQVMAGTTSHGATMLGPGHIRHAGEGPTVIGMWSGGALGRARQIADYFTGAGIETTAVEDVRSVVWGKLLVNVGINAVTALTGIKNGQILDLEATRNLSRAAVEEAVAVAKALGVGVRDDAVEHVLAVAKATAANRSSMGQDVDHGRHTEIDAINGAVVREAAKVGVDTPVNRTLTALVETLQAHYGP